MSSEDYISTKPSHWGMLKSPKRKHMEDYSYVVPLSHMSKIQETAFMSMILAIKRADNIEVIACVDGKDYRWQCDALKYAYLSNAERATNGDSEEAAHADMLAEALKYYSEADYSYGCGCCFSEDGK